jgi:hypothetical protein
MCVECNEDGKFHRKVKDYKKEMNTMTTTTTKNKVMKKKK